MRARRLTGKGTATAGMKQRDLKTMRVAVISMHSSPLGELGTRDTGGMSVYIRELSRHLGAAGYEIDIYTRRRGPERAAVERPSEGVRVIHLDAGEDGSGSLCDLHRQVPAFLESIERHRRERDLDYDLVHSHYWLSGLAGQALSRRWKVPHVVMFHTLGALKDRALGTAREPEMRVRAERHLAVCCDRVFTATAGEREELIRDSGAASRSVRVVPCGVDLERFRLLDRRAARSGLGLAPELPLVLFVGRFDPIKGIERFLEAVARLKTQAAFHVALVGGEGGSGGSAGVYGKLCADLAIQDRVVFCGRMPQEALPRYYAAADVLVVPSYYESFGLVALEALACGTPVVATPVGAMKALIADGVNGFLTRDNRSESLAEALLKGLHWRGTRQANPASIRETVLAYEWRAIAKAVCAEYRKLLRDWAARAEAHAGRWPAGLCLECRRMLHVAEVRASS